MAIRKGIQLGLLMIVLISIIGIAYAENPGGGAIRATAFENPGGGSGGMLENPGGASGIFEGTGGGGGMLENPGGSGKS